MSAQILSRTALSPFAAAVGLAAPLVVLFVLCANLWDWPRPVVLIAFGAAATTTFLSGFDYIYRAAKSAEPETPWKE